MLSFKKELVFGLVSVFIVALLVVWSTVRYEQQKASLASVAATAPINSNVVLTSGEITKHNNPNDCWIIIENKVYDVTNFLSRHPGGGGRIVPYCAKDATQAFLTKDGRGSHSAAAFQLLGLIYIGDVNGKVVQQPDKKAIQTVPISGGDDD